VNFLLDDAALLEKAKMTGAGLVSSTWCGTPSIQMACAMTSDPARRLKWNPWENAPR
jgi:hypothetical protein